MNHIKREHLKMFARGGRVVGAQTLKVLLWLDEVASPDGWVTCRLDRPAEALGMTNQQVSLSLRQLYKSGVVVRHHTPGQELNVRFAEVV